MTKSRWPVCHRCLDPMAKNGNQIWLICVKIIPALSLSLSLTFSLSLTRLLLLSYPDWQPSLCQSPPPTPPPNQLLFPTLFARSPPPTFMHSALCCGWCLPLIQLPLNFDRLLFMKSVDNDMQHNLIEILMMSLSHQLIMIVQYWCQVLPKMVTKQAKEKEGIGFRLRYGGINVLKMRIPALSPAPERLC